MSAALKKVISYALAVAVGIALGLVLLAAFLPAARAAILEGLAGAGAGGAIIAGILKLLFAGKEARTDAPSPKTKDAILADDPQHSLDRLPDDARTDLDAKIDADARARADAILKRHGG